MAEYEGKADSEICFSCKFFLPVFEVNYKTGEKTKTLRGMCKKHWRLNQKDDTKTHATNWCQFYEANMDKKKLLEDALQMITPDPDAPITLTSEERERMNSMMRSDDALDAAYDDRSRVPYEDGDEVASDASPHDWINDPLVSAHVVNENIRGELGLIMQALVEFQHSTERQLIAAAIAGDNFGMMETKGSLRVINMFRSQIEARIKDLLAEFSPHGRDEI
jgi:hypothetical protein